MKLTKKITILALMAFAMVCGPLWAQQSAVDKLAAKIPGKPVFMVGFEGLETVEPELKKTTLYKLIEDPATQKFIEQCKNELINNPKIKKEMGQIDMAQIQQILTMVKSVADCPMILGATENAKNPLFPANVFFVLDAGENKDKLMPLYGMLEKELKSGSKIIEINGHKLYANKHPGDDEPKGYIGWMGNYFVAVFGEDNGSTVKNLTGTKAISTPAYTKHLTKTNDATGILTLYIDAPAIGNIIETAVIKEEGDDARGVMDIIKSVIDKLGLGEITTLSSRVAIKDGENAQ